MAGSGRSGPPPPPPPPSSSIAMGKTAPRVGLSRQWGQPPAPVPAAGVPPPSPGVAAEGVAPLAGGVATLDGCSAGSAATLDGCSAGGAATLAGGAAGGVAPLAGAPPPSPGVAAGGAATLAGGAAGGVAPLAGVPPSPGVAAGGATTLAGGAAEGVPPSSFSMAAGGVPPPSFSVAAGGAAGGVAPLAGVPPPSPSKGAAHKEHDCIPDEHYVQTVFSIKGLEHELERRTLTYTSWNHSSSDPKDKNTWHPMTFEYDTSSPERVNAIKSIDHVNYQMEYRTEWCQCNGTSVPCFLFARKFFYSAAMHLLEEGALGPLKSAQLLVHF